MLHGQRPSPDGFRRVAEAVIGNAKGFGKNDFKIELATRSDDIHLQMTQAQMETFDENGKPQMKIEMPRSVLDLNTKIVTSESPATVRREPAPRWLLLPRGVTMNRSPSFLPLCIALALVACTDVPQPTAAATSRRRER